MQGHVSIFNASVGFCELQIRIHIHHMETELGNPGRTQPTVQQTDQQTPQQTVLLILKYLHKPSHHE